MIFPCILGDKKGIRPKKKPVPIIPRGAKNSQKKNPQNHGSFDGKIGKIM